MNNLSRAVKSLVIDIIDSNQSQFSESQDIFSQEDVAFFYTINLAIICGIVSLLGIVTNSINIVVFLRQGFQETINISLFALAISDLCSLISLLFVSICYNPFLMYSDLPVIFVQLQHNTGAWIHVIFVRITSLITVFITFERCLCITFPLKVKTIITPKRVKIIIIVIYTFVLLNLTPLFLGSNIGWQYIPSLNRTMLTNIYNKNWPFLETFTQALQPFYLVFCFSSVVILSYILISKLNSRSKWMQTASTSASEQKSMVRDRQIVKMVAYLAIIFIISYIPTLALFIAMLNLPGLTIGKTYHNSFILSYSIAFAFEGINSSINMFVYYLTSTNYRSNFSALFSRHRKE